MGKRNVHVLQKGEGWTVAREGSPYLGAYYRSFDAALDMGACLAARERVELFVHAAEGTEGATAPPRDRAM
ncbi:DUF2188 domain-containing protein [Cupriavidus sp. 30B13]|uniref:DUF2188 domain-containing protein n=1 Tax=Cupriavidus sp. 30B13 TaxID=3384241 RepID=UPI003B8F42BE